jgi:hypothetical protein
MFTLKGFHLSEKLYESKKSVVYRGVRESDKLPVVVKFLRAEYPWPAELDRDSIVSAILKKVKTGKSFFHIAR